MEKFRAGKPSRQLKAIVRSVFVCMPVCYEVKPDNLTVLDEIWFFVNFGGKKVAYSWLKYLIISTLISIIKVADVRIF